MGPAQMSRLVYRGLYFTINALVVRPGAVFFAILLLAMMLAKTGPVGLSENTLLWMQDLYRGGPAEAGHLNVEICADDAGSQEKAPAERLQTPPVPAGCERSAITTVSIGEAAEELGQILVLAYAVALIIGNGIWILFLPQQAAKRPKGERAGKGRREGVF